MSDNLKVVDYALLRTFRELFTGQKYKHRDSSLGDLVASQLYEDLVLLNKSSKLVERVHRHERVVNLANKAIGKESRRGDGTFGELVPTAVALTEHGMHVGRGPVANIEIGVETKILGRAKARISMSQVLRFRATNVEPFPFEWVDYEETRLKYSAVLLRISREYERRFA